MNFKQNQIPQHRDMENWQAIEIREDQTNLIPVSELDSKYIIEQPQYFLWEIPHALESCYVREEVAERLLNATKLLPEGYKFLVWDCYRPYEVQKALFDQYYAVLKKENPTLSGQQLDILTRKYVSYPTRNQASPAPHSTGGAVDLTIIDENNQPLHMGTDFDAFTAESATRFYEEKLQQEGFLPQTEKLALENRRMLYHVMTEVGFTNYPEEWWHFDFGDQWWAKQANAPYAHFGITALHQQKEG